MPTYEYKCTSCSHTFERVQRMTDKPVRRCPECGRRVEKVFHPVPIVFNGEEPESGHAVTLADLEADDDVDVHYVRRQSREADRPGEPDGGDDAEALPQDVDEGVPPHQVPAQGRFAE